MKQMKRIKRKDIIIIAIVLILMSTFGIYCYCENNVIEITHHTYVSNKLPQDFDGFKIAHVSDLHNKSFGDGNIKLLKLISAENPDIIVITGDIVDGSRTDIDIAIEFIADAVKLAPVYYVPGNHEMRISGCAELEERMLSLGATVLKNSAVNITRNDSNIKLYGYKPVGNYIDKSTIFEPDPNEFNMLLAHFPEDIDDFAKDSFDLIFSGHAHGGQFKLPLIGSVYAPGQGFFPEYTEGTVELNSTTMIISRGLGNSIIPIRINNNPELIFCTLKNNQTQGENK